MEQKGAPMRDLELEKKINKAEEKINSLDSVITLISDHHNFSIETKIIAVKMLKKEKDKWVGHFGQLVEMGIQDAFLREGA